MTEEPWLQGFVGHRGDVGEEGVAVEVGRGGIGGLGDEALAEGGKAGERALGLRLTQGHEALGGGGEVGGKALQVEHGGDVGVEREEAGGAADGDGEEEVGQVDGPDRAGDAGEGCALAFGLAEAFGGGGKGAGGGVDVLQRLR